jgi:predicted lipoprotein with Yx(FWY)xxD motif
MKRTSHKITGFTSLIILVGLVLTACQQAPQSVPTKAPVPTTAPTQAPAATATNEANIPETGGDVTLKVASTSLGEILVDGKGMTLYMFTKDTENKSNCAGGCLEAWPPLLAGGEVTAGDGVDAALIGKGDLGDGRKIVTYNGMPLYYWKNDAKPGDTTGQDVNEVWYVVAPDGKPIGMGEPAASATSTGEVKDTGSGGDVTVAVASTSLGDILVDGKGMTLYMFTKDTANKSNCAGGCLEAWPPLLAGGTVTAGEGVDEALIGEGDLGDGRKIVTYNGMPLYYWKGDVKPGDTTGQNVNDVWYVVAPDGKPVDQAGE